MGPGFFPGEKTGKVFSYLRVHVHLNEWLMVGGLPGAQQKAFRL